MILNEIQHKPVALSTVLRLARPVVDSLSESANNYLIDGTLGLAGHASSFLTEFPQLNLIGIDRDETALSLAAKKLMQFSDRVRLIHATYDEITKIITNLQLNNSKSKFVLIMLDLGVSSLQLDLDDRGFAYSRDTPLDMRMDRNLSLTAAEILNTYTLEEIILILKEFGEEKFAVSLAKAIINYRKNNFFTTSKTLVDLIYQVIPYTARRQGGHPAKRVFQALRIAVNNELKILSDALPRMLNLLAPGGRMLVMSYQSLEDRIVKQIFKTKTTARTPLELPITLPEDKPEYQLVFNGSKTVDSQEKASNPRAASVRIRAIERLRK